MRVTGAARWSGLVACATLAVFAGRSAKAGPVSFGAVIIDDDKDWRRVATTADRARLRSWRGAWIAALARVRAGGLTTPIDADPVLFDPDRALADPVPPAGAYRCRVIKLGANGTAMRELTQYPTVDCRVDSVDGRVQLSKVGGPQRPVGVLFDETSSRAVFLGTMLFGDERRPLAYGRDGTRDMAGYVERIGAHRWRLVLPSPRFESLLDVVEIVPAE